MTTAIDRLRQMAVLGERAAGELVWTVPNINWREDVAAVDALYQAAKGYVDELQRTDIADYGTLAAAVSRVAGTASPQETDSRVDSCETREGE